MNIFETKDYVAFLKKRLKLLEGGGRGELSRIAKAIGAHPSLVSQILAGDRDLSQEQTYDLALYLGLTESETEYFYILVSYRRAGNPRLKSYLDAKLQKLTQASQNLSKRFAHEKTLADEEKAIFYSSWLYSAIRLYCSTKDKGLTQEDLENHFHLQKTRVREILTFLTQNGLVEEEKGRYKMGTQRTFLPKESPYLIQHHKNWRLKSMQSSEKITEDEQMFTCPMSVSKADFAKIKRKLGDFIEELSPIIKDSPAEDIACINLDLFWIRS